MRTFLPNVPTAISNEVADRMDAVTRELALLDGQIGAPVEALLRYAEAASSTLIAGLPSSAEQFAVAGLGRPRTLLYNAKLVAANMRATEVAVRHAETGITEIEIAALNTALGKRSHPLTVGYDGEGRDVVIGLVGFMRRSDLPVLMQAALVRAHIRELRPFLGGNGRTGRALMQAVLRAKGVTTRSTIPLSSGLLPDPASCSIVHARYRAGEVGPIVERLVHAATRATGNARLGNTSPGRRYWVAPEVLHLMDAFIRRARSRRPWRAS